MYKNQGQTEGSRAPPLQWSGPIMPHSVRGARDIGECSGGCYSEAEARVTNRPHTPIARRPVTLPRRTTWRS